MIPESKKAKVHIIYTGGTIGMARQKLSEPSSPLTPKPLEELLQYVPAIASLNFDLSYESFNPPLDSSNLGLTHWMDMAKRVEEVYDSVDGFVVLHGTDTMAYTSSALSFMFENLAKPVVITGSQLPISDARTDAIQNFVNAIYIAGYKAVGLPRIPEVVVVFADKVLRGCRTRKVSSSSLLGFDSPNFSPLGLIGEHIVINRANILPLPDSTRPFQVNTLLSNEVLDITLFPGLKPNLLRRLLQDENVKGAVLRTYGAGNAPDEEEFLKTIGDATKNGKIIVSTIQTTQGMVELGLYEASSGLLDRGVISGLDITPEAALTKLMLTLGSKREEQVSAQMQVSLRGEQSYNLLHLRFGSSAGNQEKFENYSALTRRFEVKRIYKAVLRFVNFELEGLAEGEEVELKIFVNSPSVSPDTSSDEPRCIAHNRIKWNGHTQIVQMEVDKNKFQSYVGDDELTLTVVARQNVRFCFDSLNLDVFTHS